jgi:hypothetical protein
LRTGEELEVTLNDGKHAKITLNAEYFFYLAGECVNESVGMKITGTIRTMSSVTVQPESQGRFMTNR